MNRNRTAGIRAEQQIAAELRAIGFEGVVTTRAESRNMDDRGIDLTQLPNSKPLLPCYFQIKKTVNTPNIHELLSVDHGQPMAIIHFKEEKKGKRFYTVGEYVYIDKEFFYKLLKHAYIKLPENTGATDRSSKVQGKVGE